MSSDGDCDSRSWTSGLDLCQSERMWQRIVFARKRSSFSVPLSQSHGYHYADAYSETASLHTTNTNASISSLKSNGSILVQSRNKDDVGFRAVMALLGCDYELLSYAIGECDQS